MDSAKLTFEDIPMPSNLLIQHFVCLSPKVDAGWERAPRPAMDCKIDIQTGDHGLYDSSSNYKELSGIYNSAHSGPPHF